MKRNILSITEVDDKFYFEVVCVDKVRDIAIEHKLEYVLDRKSEQFKQNIENFAVNVANDLVIKGYQDYPVHVTLHLQKLFVERIEMPKLSQKETKRAFNLELAKLYGEYDAKYAISVIGYPINKELVMIEAAMYNATFYNIIMRFLYGLNMNVSKVTLAACNLKNLLIDENLIEVEIAKNEIVVYISDNFTSIIVIEDKRVVFNKIISEGLKNCEAKLTNMLNESEDIEILIEKYGIDYRGAYKAKNYNKIIKKEFSKTFFELKNMITQLSLEKEINDIYIYTEEDSIEKKYFATAFSEKIGFDMKVIDTGNPKIRELLTLSVFVAPTNYDFTLPIVVKKDEDKK